MKDKNRERERGKKEFYVYYEKYVRSFLYLIAGIMSEVIQTNCKKCTERQKEMFTEIKNWFKQNKLEQWDALVAKSVEDMKKKNADS